MAQYTYAVAPFMGRMKGRQSLQSVSDQIQQMIDQHVDVGWEFMHLASVNIEVARGCLAAFFGKKASYMRYDYLFFRKPSQ